MLYIFGIEKTRSLCRIAIQDSPTNHPCISLCNRYISTCVVHPSETKKNAGCDTALFMAIMKEFNDFLFWTGYASHSFKLVIVPIAMNVHEVAAHCLSKDAELIGALQDAASDLTVHVSGV